MGGWMVAVGVGVLAVLAGGGFVATRLVSVSPAVVADGARLPTEWYAAGGIIRPEGRVGPPSRPGTGSAMYEWIVLLNLGRLPATATTTFYFEDRPPTSATTLVPGHGRRRAVPDELPDDVPVDVPYGIRVTSASPLVVQVTRGEFVPHDQVTGAMSSFMAYPGPLGPRETRWAYADGLVESTNGPLEEREWVAILNPGTRDAAVTVTFLANDGRRAHALVVPAERVRWLDLFTLPILPKNAPFGVVVASDAPIVVEHVRRVFRKGEPYTSAMFASLAEPIGAGGPPDEGEATPAP